MNSGVKYLFNFLDNLKFPRIMRNLNRKKVLILTYHGFSDERQIDHNPLHINIKKFREQIKFLKKYYKIISLEQLIWHYRDGIGFPDYTAVITIDDGYKSFYKLAYPVLKELRATASVFLATDFIEKKSVLWYDRIEYAINHAESGIFSFEIDKEKIICDLRKNSRKLCCDRISSKLKSIPQDSLYKIVEEIESSLKQKLRLNNATEIYHPLGWREIREMMSSGLVSIGSHTCSHRILSRCSWEELRKELLFSKQIIGENTGVDCNLFSYPNGCLGDFNKNTKNLLKEFGYLCGLTTVSGMNDCSSDVFELKRLHVSSDTDQVLFSMIVSGTFNLFVDLRNLIKNKN